MVRILTNSVAFLSLYLLLSCTNSNKDLKYEPNWESLSKQVVPDWFMDAKFGIYAHWGVYSVPAYGDEWYPRHMHDQDHSVNRHHLEKYGDPTKFGYHDFVPMFTAENFNADEWAELFVKAGAKFAGPVAEHHDGFAMWDSDLTTWNAVDKGPKQDIVLALEKAIKKRGMKFITTFHHARNSLWEVNKDNWAGHFDYVKKNYPTLLEDTESALLYGYIPREEFLVLWKEKLREVIDKYQPDLIWFDSWLHEIPDSVKMDFLTYYFNSALKWNKEVVVTYKQEDLPREVAVEDFEKGRLDRLTEYPWLTDDAISWGSWCYTEDLEIKSIETVLHTFIDIVSKNGVLLLNISPKADGTIPEDQKNVLLGVGDWLKVNGEAIYNTRPWIIYGEGPTQMKKAGHFVGRVDYEPQDIRFTRKGNTLYAISLGIPAKVVRIKKLGLNSSLGLECENVSMVGSKENLDWSREDEALVINLPENIPGKHALVFKIDLLGYNYSDIQVEVYDKHTIKASLTLENYNDKVLEKEVYLFVNDKIVETKNVKAVVGTKVDITFNHTISEYGDYQISIGDNKFLIHATNEIVIPSIYLEGEWKFKKGDDLSWKAPGLMDDNWEMVDLPQSWENHSKYTDDNVYGWYRKKIIIPEQWKGNDLIITLGKIDDVDQTYFNGKKIGEKGRFIPNYQTAYDDLREYKIPTQFIEFGKENTISVRVFDAGGNGGIYAGPMGPIKISRP